MFYLFVGCDVLSAPSIPKLVGGTIIHSSLTFVVSLFTDTADGDLLVLLLPASPLTRCQLQSIHQRKHTNSDAKDRVSGEFMHSLYGVW